MKKRLFSVIFICTLLLACALPAMALDNIVLENDKIPSSVTISGTVTSDAWVSIKITDQSQSIVYFNGAKANSQGKYSFTADLSDYTLPLNMTLSYGEKTETAQIKLKSTGGGEIGGGGGGGGDSSSSGNLLVSFETNSGSKVADVRLAKDSKLTKPANPTKTGYTFGGWFADKELTQAFDFDSKITKDTTLYAKWDKDSSVVDGQKPNFKDINNHWAKDAILLLTEKGIINGRSNTEFAPNANITRAEFITLLYKMSGDKPPTETAKFADVPADAWCAASVAWGVDAGIAKGTTTTQFNPSANITRQEAAVMIARYMEKMGFTLIAGSISFKDTAKIAPFASDSVAKVVLASLMQGKEDNNFDPNGYATRAEVAVILQRVLAK